MWILISLFPPFLSFLDVKLDQVSLNTICAVVLFYKGLSQQPPGEAGLPCSTVAYDVDSGSVAGLAPIFQCLLVGGYDLALDAAVGCEVKVAEVVPSSVALGPVREMRFLAAHRPTSSATTLQKLDSYPAKGFATFPLPMRPHKLRLRWR